jgi:hypothetical protein
MDEQAARLNPSRIELAEASLHGTSSATWRTCATSAASPGEGGELSSNMDPAAAGSTSRVPARRSPPARRRGTGPVRRVLRPPRARQGGQPLAGHDTDSDRGPLHRGRPDRIGRRPHRRRMTLYLPKSHPGWSGSVFVLVQDAAEAITAMDA